ncbi:MAG: M28 family peptidase [Chitinophagales bacterium]|jgi:Zn-dependent M28 family amino/carboxypeptidase|nr:M28 family peptidase [Chitinophagales bacterium]
MIRIFLLFLTLSLILGCDSSSASSVAKKVDDFVHRFDASLAKSYIQRQVSLGHRVPGSAMHKVCGDSLILWLSKSCDTVYEQSFEVKTFDQKNYKGRNIIAKINPHLTHRIMLSAHWDTRAFADNEPNKNQPILGADDGASGVGVILALADYLSTQTHQIGVDIVLFDLEDYGYLEGSPYPQVENSYCLGSQHWARNIPQGYVYPYANILLDMVGGRGATFFKEGISMGYAPNLVDQIWTIAHQLGYDKFFPLQENGMITDDHYYVNSIANIPSIDIIHTRLNSDKTFAPWHHTVGDDMSVIDLATLEAVGQTLLYYLFTQETKTNPS